jgi:hypothetical protein
LQDFSKTVTQVFTNTVGFNVLVLPQKSTNTDTEGGNTDTEGGNTDAQGLGTWFTDVC